MVKRNIYVKVNNKRARTNCLFIGIYYIPTNIIFSWLTNCFGDRVSVLFFLYQIFPKRTKNYFTLHAPFSKMCTSTHVCLTYVIIKYMLILCRNLIRKLLREPFGRVSKFFFIIFYVLLFRMFRATFVDLLR